MRRSQPWLGTLVEITVRHRDVDAAQRAIDAGFAAIALVHRAMSPRIEGSDVDRINRAAVHEPVSVSAATWRVLRIADQLHRRSDGLFDCAGDAAPSTGAEPAGGHEAPSQRHLSMSPSRKVVKRRPLAIDLGGIAKGFAVDVALSALRDAGAISGCVNAGGDLAVFGAETFRIDLRGPAEPGRRHRLVDLRNFAAAASSIEERNALLTGPHALRVDRRSFDEGATVCVLAPLCVLADAFTKLVALSGETSHHVLGRHGATAAILPANRSDPGQPDHRNAHRESRSAVSAVHPDA